MSKINFVLLLLHFYPVSGTIDLNLPELQYLADHLHEEECRKLVAALHFKSYQEPNALEQAEGKVSKDVPCLTLLLHWNSERGQGKGETHEVVQHRLRQLGKVALADWLGKTVFHQLGTNIENNLEDSFDQILSTSYKTPVSIKLSSPQKMWNPTNWLAIDTICWSFITGLTLITVFLMFKLICSLCLWKRKKRPTTNYVQIRNQVSDTESEEKFDIISHKHGFTTPENNEI